MGKPCSKTDECFRTRNQEKPTYSKTPYPFKNASFVICWGDFAIVILVTDKPQSTMWSR